LQFIWYAHAAAGRQAGLRDDLVDNLREKQALTDLEADELAVVNYGRELFRTHRVSQAAFDAVVAEFGVRGAVELSSLMGYYAMLAFTINAFEAMPPADGPEPLLPVESV
jgi:4-carboxymuconolactone decarboxylase